MKVLSFHTTMVLTQLVAAGFVGGVLAVSIPLWFSRNLTKTRTRSRLTCSFHTTMVLTQLD